MVRTFVIATLLFAQSTTGGGCLSSIRNSVPTGAGNTVSMETYGGAWSSLAASALPKTCTDFSWKVTDWTTTSASGTWTARCLSAIPVTGTASGALVDGEVRWTATGTGTAEGVSCPVALSGTATLDNAQIKIPYSGSTCLGTVSGTELLRK